MIVAVTGPTGGIGLDLIESLIERGDQVIAITNPNSLRNSKIPKSKHVQIIECEMSNYTCLMGKYRCDIFYHLAWSNTSGSGRDDVRIQLANISNTLDAVDLAVSWGAKIFVGTGSQAEYGISTEPLNERTPVNPISGYGIAKYSAGKLCHLYCEQKGIIFKWARILSVFGVNDSKNTLILYVIDTLLKGISPELTKCEQIWDYIYSKDCAEALIVIGDKGVDGYTYCVGSGKPRLLKEFVVSIRDMIDPSIDLNFGAKEYYPHQPMMLCADITELVHDTNF